MTGQPSSGALAGPAAEAGTPVSATIDALRKAQGNRAAWQKRLAPILVVGLATVSYQSSRQAPGIGLHGKPLVLAIGLAGFSAGVLGMRETMLVRKTSVRVYGPVLALLLVSSGLLLWVQPAGPGTSGCIFAIAVGIAARLIAPRLGISLILIVICTAAFLISLSTTGQTQHHGVAGFAGGAVSFIGVFLYVLVVWRFREQDERSQRLLGQMEETRDAELRAAALAERQRLAREMHDVLAHSLSGLVVQLEGARMLALSDPADERLAATIDRAHQLAKSGLDEARQAISMLRDDELPGPGKLAALTRSFQADTGVRCRYVVLGEPRDLRSAVRLALYRVTQEALTNVGKHAHPEQVEVRLEYLRDDVTLTVADFAAANGGPPPAVAVEDSGGGYGLTGMRERAELLGGTLTAGPTGHGFQVLLRVPA